jgi:hypothetical protein
MSWFEDLKKSMQNSLKEDIEQMTKADADKLPEKTQSETQDSNLVRGKAILTDPYFEQASNNYFLSKNKISRISNRTLRDMSQRDWLVSTILQIRADTVLRFSRRPERKYDMGFRIVKRNQNEPITEEDIHNINMLESFVYNCGRTENVPKGQEMLLGEFLKLLVRDGLTFGYVAVEKVLTRTGALHRFRPLPAETMYLINQAISKNVIDDQVKTAIEMYHKKKSDNDPRADGYLAPREIDYYKYVQLSTDNRVLNAFGDEDMVFKLFNPQNYADSNGYCISVVEQAIIMITNHLNIEAYNANFFTHGYAARGILHLKGAVTQNTLASFRRQFYNTISGSANAWRTPIVAGLDDVQWVPMSGSAREMEYINFNSHIMRAICAQFQIDPIEVGLDYLTTANGRASSQAKESGQFKITYSRERGLVPILMIVEDLLNQDILPSLDKDLAEKYKFKFVGYTDDTAMTDISLRQAQMTVFSSMNDLLHSEEKTPIDHPAAKLPLNQSFWNLVEKNMTRGEIRELFFGDVGASKRPELQYIPADPAFLSWNQLMMTINAQQQQKETQKEQMKQQQKMQEHQIQLQQGKEQRDQEAHDNQIDQAKQEQANAVVRSQDDKGLQEIAKQYGATKATNIGGKELKNPINLLSEEEKE